jgi:hypothetical protein
MRVDAATKTFSFGFAPAKIGHFSRCEEGRESPPYLQGLLRETSGLLEMRDACPDGFSVRDVIAEFPTLFSSTLGVARVAPYVIELSDTKPVRSPPYRCAPPKLEVFKNIVSDLLEQGVIRPSKSPYASPAFLVPKKGGDSFRMVVDYRKVNPKIVFDSYPMPTIDQAFEQLGGAVLFSVFDLNSAYYQIPLSASSRPVTAFCTPFGLYEFNSLPMGISVGSQGLSRVIDELFADLKGRWVFNFLDDLVVYSSSVEEHAGHVREVLRRF